jgi:serine/threonine protein kinase
MPSAPPLGQVQAAFPDWSIKQLIGEGTFKTTYKAEKDGLLEAIKLFYVPEFEDSEEGATARINFLGRLSREIHLLGQCKTPYLVKLGCIEPNEINIGGVFFIAYSEQLLTGVTLRNLINCEVSSLGRRNQSPFTMSRRSDIRTLGETRLCS